MNRFIEEINKRVLVFDGSKGYMLQKAGLAGGECPELWNVEKCEKVRAVYEAYRDAGADVIQTNTFQGSRIQLEKYGLGDRVYELNYEGARLAREIMGKEGFVAASVGPTGLLFEPSGELTFEKAYHTFAEQVKALADAGVDAINFETFTDIAEMRAAIIAARDVTDLPLICSMAFEAGGRTLMGTDPFTVAVILKSLGVEMIGANCSSGPEHLLGIIEKMYDAGGIMLSAKPNAGIPDIVDGQAVYGESAQEFARYAGKFIQYGVRLLGGCCGTTPEFVAALKKVVPKEGTKPPEDRTANVIASTSKCLDISEVPELNKGYLCDDELLKELVQGSTEGVIDRALDLSVEEYDAIVIDTGDVPGDAALLSKVVDKAQGYLKEPFIIRTNNAEALDLAIRIYRGRAGVIIPQEARDNRDKLVETAKKYGALLID